MKSDIAALGGVKTLSAFLSKKFRLK